MPDFRNLGELAEYAQRQVQQIQRMQSELATQSGKGVSPREYVRARTGPGGALQDLQIDPAALRLPVAEVAAEVIAAVSAAQRQYAERADALMAPVLDIRPHEQAVEAVEEGVSRLDGLTADLERLARRHGLDS